jgi:hypothetical protein
MRTGGFFHVGKTEERFKLINALLLLQGLARVKLDAFMTWCLDTGVKLLVYLSGMSAFEIHLCENTHLRAKPRISVENC